MKVSYESKTGKVELSAFIDFITNEYKPNYILSMFENSQTLDEQTHNELKQYFPKGFERVDMILKFKNTLLPETKLKKNLSLSAVNSNNEELDIKKRDVWLYFETYALAMFKFIKNILSEKLETYKYITNDQRTNQEVNNFVLNMERLEEILNEVGV